MKGTCDIFALIFYIDLKFKKWRAFERETGTANLNSVVYLIIILLKHK